MTQNRLQQVLRDPTFESPSREYFEVRMTSVSYAVTRSSAERVMEALVGLHRAPWVRAETVTGSTVWIRTAAVVSVREWTEVQRASEQEFWQAIEAEARSEEGETPAPVEASGTEAGTSPEATATDLESGMGFLASLMWTAVFILLLMVVRMLTV